LTTRFCGGDERNSRISRKRSSPLHGGNDQHLFSFNGGSQMSATTALAFQPDVPADDVVPTSVSDGPAAEQPRVETPPADLTTHNQASVTAPQTSARQGDRKQLIERVRDATLPPALCERLIAVVQASGEQPPPLDHVLAAVEESLPEFLRGGGQQPQRSEHPAGEAFFRGSDELSDAEADSIAREQLQRSGLLRGQRVRVAD
jgi:hypothetical protein